MRVTSKQVLVEGGCFQVNMEKINWFEAQWRCSRYGYKLAIIKSNSQLTQLQDTIRHDYGIFKLDYFWIGFSRIRYRIYSKGGGNAI